MTTTGSTDHTAPTLAARLVQARRDIDPLLREAVGTLPAGRVGDAARYYFGWIDPEGRPTGKMGGGKSIRAALVLDAATALGAEPAAALPAAAAVELIQAFTLLTDDVLDRDRTRHGQPATWTIHTAPTALLAGNALLSLALTLPGLPPGAARLLGHATAVTCEGADADTAFESRTDTTWDQCLTMTRQKAGVFLGATAGVGAQCAAADPSVVDLLVEAFTTAGVAFQCANDMLGVWGDAARTGKPTGSDLAGLKRTLVTVDALAHDSAAGRALATLYATRTPLTPSQTARATELVNATDAGPRALHFINQQIQITLALLDQAVPDPAARRNLEALATLPISYYTAYADERGPRP
ncbi:family 2 encapsulin nanocompartment cargo protein polyprenyl transferase [Streptomyces venetus]|uniref:Family 2 encapsulin nanocompartment cargo protein polyprenyl transferase n=1 Tax=Streptomyces venetus TaxID=1701086 RepID=A0ABP8GTG1_9ACTN